ncbi:putative proline-rich protein 21 [Penaeus vannamei]|uniref:Putative proline-rich protein 21 n=1 Tax=Penaeus vannamei TaxID=6689 RepID=A0A3R7QJM2_PENVA|nr:putative proline-rich protein 21 [Penaeus vannamei]
MGPLCLRAPRTACVSVKASRSYQFQESSPPSFPPSLSRLKQCKYSPSGRRDSPRLSLRLTLWITLGLTLAHPWLTLAAILPAHPSDHLWPHLGSTFGSSSRLTLRSLVLTLGQPWLTPRLPLANSAHLGLPRAHPWPNLGCTSAPPTTRSSATLGSPCRLNLTTHPRLIPWPPSAHLDFTLGSSSTHLAAGPHTRAQPLAYTSAHPRPQPRLHLGLTAVRLTSVTLGPLTRTHPRLTSAHLDSPCATSTLDSLPRPSTSAHPRLTRRPQPRRLANPRLTLGSPRLTSWLTSAHLDSTSAHPRLTLGYPRLTLGSRLWLTLANPRLAPRPQLRLPSLTPRPSPSAQPRLTLGSLLVVTLGLTLGSTPGLTLAHPRLTLGSPLAHPRLTLGSPSAHPRLTLGSPSASPWPSPRLTRSPLAHPG